MTALAELAFTQRFDAALGCRRAGRGATDPGGERDAEARAARHHAPVHVRLAESPDATHEEASRAYAGAWLEREHGGALSDAQRALLDSYLAHLSARALAANASALASALATFHCPALDLDDAQSRPEEWLAPSLHEAIRQLGYLDGKLADDHARVCWAECVGKRLGSYVAGSNEPAHMRTAAGERFESWRSTLGSEALALPERGWQDALSAWLSGGARAEQLTFAVQCLLAHHVGAVNLSDLDKPTRRQRRRRR